MEMNQQAKGRTLQSLGFLLSSSMTKKFVLTMALSFLAVSMSGCGGAGGAGNSGGSGDSVSQPGQSGQGPELPFVLKSRSVFAVAMPTSSSLSIMSTSTAVPISVVNAPNSSMTVDVSGFRAPSITNAVLNFGNIRISALVDNDLAVCGANAQTACTQAVIRIYTTGTAGPGIYNTAGGYGMPITAKQGSLAALVVGLTSAAAAEMQTVTIGAGKHAVVTADLTPSPSYAVSSDFTNAGAGSYATTLVVEYGLR